MDTENDILQTYRRKENEFHLPLREGGWEKLEKELATRPVTLRRMPYRWWVAAAVMLLCVAISIPVFLPEETVVAMSEHQPIKTDKPGQTEENPIQPTRNVPVTLPQPSRRIVTSTSQPTANEGEEEVAIVSEWPMLADAEPPTEADSAAVSHKNVGPEPESNRTTLSKDILATRSKRHRKNVGNWSWGVHGGSGKTTTNLLGLNSYGTIPPNYTQQDPLPPIKPEEPDEENPDNEKTQSRTTLSTAVMEYHHRLPLTVGLSVRKQFTDKFALESGLSYTFLYSDLSQPGIKSYIGNQQIHYLGIPLKANYTFYTQDRFSLYLSGGALFEYMLSARRRMMNETWKLDINRWQFSLSASIGAEMKLFRPVSLYLEPGLGYYFDNGSSIPTIRTERPWMFGLQLGLRFSY